MKLPDPLGPLKRLIRTETSNAVSETLVKNAVPQTLTGPAWSSISTNTRAQSPAIKSQEQAYTQVSWVNRAVGSVIESSRRAGLLVYRVRKQQARSRGLSLDLPGWAARAKAEGLPLTPVADPMELLQNPLRDWSCGWDELFEQTLGFYLLRGWVGWWCPLGASKTPVVIRIVPRAAVNEIVIEDGVVRAYKVRAGREVVSIPEEQLCVMRRWNPLSPVEGLSPIESAMLTADTDHAQSQAAQAMARRGTYQQGFLTTDKEDISPEQARDVQSTFESRYGGPQEAFKTPVVTNGFTWQKTGLTMRELGFLDVRKFNREEIGALFGVPPVKMGDWSNSYYNSREQARSFWLDGIEPTLKRFKRFLDSQFLPYWGRELAADWDVSEIAELQDDKREQAEVGARLVEARILSPNEVRDEYFGRVPYDGGDAILAGMGLMPSGSAPRPRPESQSDPARKSETDAAYRHLLVACAKTVEKRMEIPETVEARVRWWNLQDAIMAPQAKRLGGLLRTRVNQWLEPVDAAMLDRAQDPTVVLNSVTLSAKLAEDSLPIVRAFYVQAGERAEGVAGAKATRKFEMSDERRKFIEQMVSDWAENTTDSTIKQAEQIIREHLQAGVDIAATHDEIIAALKDVLGSEYRCEMASRTIVQGANNNATLAGWGQSQVVDGKQWLAGPPSDRRRPIHQQMSNDAKVYSLTEDFVLADGATGQHPGDAKLTLKHIVNCGCVMLAALKQLPS